ncbi:MAG: holin-like protein [Sulfurospirillum sp.]|jgi:putative effector of murein hydrolase LrgA (UPF0299 family)|nr:holin-like protein [Sulfurospirillum sp.]DAB35030.1 MAG TPA: hypothetical protein CFH82_02375 [Sulfurospirillum sp. UBA12182]
MLRGMLLLLFFQFLGELFTAFFMLKIPAAIIGMLLLLCFLMIRKKSFQSLDVSVFWLLRYLPLFIIPAATGIITQIDTISKELLAITVALFVSTLLSLALSAKMMDIMIAYKEKRR